MLRRICLAVALLFSLPATVALAASDRSWVAGFIAKKDAALKQYTDLRDKECKDDKACVIAWDALIQSRVKVEKMLLMKIQHSCDYASLAEIYSALDAADSETFEKLVALYPERVSSEGGGH